MKIVNIDDIEDIILTKHEIDTNNPDIEDRSNLTDFISKYCNLTDAIIDNDNIIPFKYIKEFNKEYLFISDKEHINGIMELLNKIKYDFNNLKQIHNYTDYMSMNMNNLYLIYHDTKYYKLS